jgi:hypothetical protein
MEKCNGDFLPPGFTANGCQPTTARTLCCTSFARRGMQQPDLATVALVKRTYVRAFPALPLLQHSPAVRCTRLSGIPVTPAARKALASEALPSTPIKCPRDCGAMSGSSVPFTAGGSGGCTTEGSAVTVWSRMGVSLSPASGSPQIRTDFERFMLMRQTVGERVCHGKSGIHGTGVFARINHKAGDWLVEYAGMGLPLTCAYIEPASIIETLYAWLGPLCAVYLLSSHRPLAR